MATFGLLISNRSFFPDHLVKTARKEILEALNKWDAIYPYGNDLTYSDGFAAEVLFSISAAAVESDSCKNEYLSKFNWQKFMEECRAFEENVWKLDKERIMKKISSGNFKKSDLKLLE